MFGFFDDPFFTTDSRRLMSLLLSDRAYKDGDDEEKEEECKKCDKKEVARRCKGDDWTSLMSWSPRSDVRETEQAYVIEAELPGVPKDGIKIEVKDNVLTISGKKETKKEWCEETKEEEKDGEKKEEKKEGEEKKEEAKKPIWHRMERTYGSFQRSFALPEGVDATKIAAASKDGILTITVPKPAVKQPEVHTIAITEH